jgi:hypothetical protein
VTDINQHSVPPMVAKLLYGFAATFSWTGDEMKVRWEPEAPSPRNIRTLKARRRFVAAYTVARDEFIRMVATVTGMEVAVVDVPANAGDKPQITVHEPETTH